MKELNVEEMKKIELSILSEIDDICKKQNINYSIAYGTLLGAIRHGGFIPWDDDIDIIMPRKDYENFVKYCMENTTPFMLLCNRTNEKYSYLFAKACDRTTKILEDVSNPYNIEYGICVDIFPVDGLGNTKEEAMKNFQKSSFYRELIVAANWKKFFRSKGRKWYIEPIRFAFFVLSRFVNANKLSCAVEKRISKIDFESVSFSASICGAYRKREIINTEIYSQFTDIAFENLNVCGLKLYDEYLSEIYGDYMKLPPEEKRVTHHMFKVYAKEKV